MPLDILTEIKKSLTFNRLVHMASAVAFRQHHSRQVFQSRVIAVFEISADSKY